MTRLALLLALSGCHALFSLDRVDDPTGDAGAGDGGARDGGDDDAMSDAPLPVCGGSGLLTNLCPSSIQAGEVSLAAQTINTDTDIRCNQVQQGSGRPDLCVIAAAAIKVTGHVTFVGNRPAVLFAQDAITITTNGVVDVSSSNARRGAGANLPACQPTAAGDQLQQDGTGGGGGGAGGSFAGRGGAGGTGDDGTARQSSGPIGLPYLRGGCQGGHGGNDFTGFGRGEGGASGGAVYLVAGTKVRVEGAIHAWGAGGRGGASGNSAELPGGGGGGSGGAIGIDAPAIELASTALLLAHGGGGGGGSDGLVGGQAGNETNPSDPTLAAQGGVGPNDAGDGSFGSSNASQTSAGGSGQAHGGSGGAGAGGGGAGYIHVYGSLTNATAIVLPSAYVFP